MTDDPTNLDDARENRLAERAEDYLNAGEMALLAEEWIEQGRAAEAAARARIAARTAPTATADVRLSERELNALEGAVISQHISVQQVVEAIIAARVGVALEAAAIAMRDAFADRMRESDGTDYIAVTDAARLIREGKP